MLFDVVFRMDFVKKHSDLQRNLCKSAMIKEEMSKYKIKKETRAIATRVSHVRWRLPTLPLS